jgi:hypothetical protein
MLILFYIGCLILGLTVGYSISKSKNRCNHKYKIIKDGEIANYDRCGNPIVVGFMKVYECENCKKMKTEKAYVN